ncbi:hypothetical protein BC830DRAFT_859607 [Chytriomyces sp. MP71]|nr:hypothetical protein BC830DRAFT_859607 [Chytriomyces sp. MP71]
MLHARVAYGVKKFAGNVVSIIEGKMATANTRGKTRARNRAGGDVLENSASMSGSRALSGLNVGLNVGLGVRGVNSRPASVSASALLVSRAPSLSQSQSQSVSVSLALAPDVLLVAARKRVASATLPPQNLLAKRPRVPANSTVCNLQNENANSNNIANADNRIDNCL